MDGELVHVAEPMAAIHLESAKRFLDHCWFIGLTETSERDIPWVCQAVGVPAPKRRANISRQHLDASARSRAARFVEEHDALDLQLFDYAQELRRG
jgi:hypothetical protein